MRSLAEIIKNHEERSHLREPYNPKVDYAKEAYQQHAEMSHLLTLICVMLKEMKSVKKQKLSGKKK